MIKCEEVARGGHAQVSADPYKIARTALLCGAKGVALAHNHPDGTATPSEEDMTVTRRLEQVLAGLGSFDTQSNEESGVTPSTPGQMVFARFLKEEFEALGLEEITLDENGYLFATLPANIDKSVPCLLYTSRCV